MARQQVPLCGRCSREDCDLGREVFQREHGLDLGALAGALAATADRPPPRDRLPLETRLACLPVAQRGLLLRLAVNCPKSIAFQSGQHSAAWCRGQRVESEVHRVLDLLDALELWRAGGGP